MRNFKKQRGITFVEVIAGILIFGLSLPAIFGGLHFAYNVVKKSSQRTSAIAKCQERIENMKNTDYVDINLTTFPNTFPENQVTLDTLGTATTNDDLFGTRTGTIVDNTDPAFKVITVTVDWKSGKYSEEVKTIISP